MIGATRINKYWFTLFKNRAGVTVNVELSTGETGKLIRNGNQFRVRNEPPIRNVLRIGYTHPDYEFVKKILEERNIKISQYREAIKYGKRKAFHL
jgi:hypothetical protein